MLHFKHGNEVKFLPCLRLFASGRLHRIASAPVSCWHAKLVSFPSLHTHAWSNTQNASVDNILHLHGMTPHADPDTQLLWDMNQIGVCC